MKKNFYVFRKNIENFLLIEHDLILLLKKYENNIIINNFIVDADIYSYYNLQNMFII